MPNGEGLDLHFAVLKEADLITSRRDGQTIWYGLNANVIEDVTAWAMPLINEGGPETVRKDGRKSK